MRLVTDNATEAAALNTLRELIGAGLAGVDCYDRTVFVVDVPTKGMRDNADVALDVLGSEMLKDGAFGAPKWALQARLKTWVSRELGLDRLGAPEIIVPLASRAVTDEQAAVLGSSNAERYGLGLLAVVADRIAGV